MPLYDYRCPEHGTFEAFRRVGASPEAPCPSCDANVPRTYANTNFTYTRPYDQAVDGEMRDDGRREIDRGGGGKAVKVSETGGWRPALTHNTECPKCHKMRNVAVTSQVGGGTLITCEACGYSWLHRADDAPAPLNEGVEESYRPGRTIHMNSDVPLHSGYKSPERAG